MSFSGNTILEDANGLESGEIFGSHVNNTDAFKTFESGLIKGRFAKYDTGSVDNMDGSATPTIIGVVARDLTSSLAKSTYDTTDDIANVHNFGYMTVDVVSGLTPVKYGVVYAENAGVNAGADYGKATTLNTGNVLVADVDFWKEIKTNVWVVRFKKIA